MAINSILTTAVSGLQKNANRAADAARNISDITPKLPSAAPNSPTYALSGNNAIDAQLIGASDTNLVQEIVNLVEASAAYSANAQVIRTAEDLSQISNDILA